MSNVSIRLRVEKFVDENWKREEKSNMKKQIGPTEILFPVPAALITSGTMEKPNIITVAWISMVSPNPLIIGIAVDKSRYSVDLIKKYKCFGVNIPSAKHFVETDYCGIVSGRKVNKFEKRDN